ncbi:MAG TPA: tetratricopeptide repeat protein [Tepidisphaeraceae bacterium]|nr:tetratricopeptide repeat protein [Tepidisphaeraceae bacterium]
MNRHLFLSVCVAGTLGLLAGCQPHRASFEAPKGVHRYVEGAELLQQGRRQQAIAELEAAVQENPDLISPRNLLGKAYRDDREYKKALVEYQNLVRLDPYTVSNHYYLGLCYHLLDQLGNAEAAYLDALRLDPRDFKSNMNLGLVKLALGEDQAAVHYLQTATDIDPKSAPAWSNYAVALDSIGHYAEAEQCYRRSLELDANNTAALLDFGTNLLLQNKTAEAQAILGPLSNRLDTPMAHKRYGDALAQSKDYTAAKKQYNITLKLDSRYYPALTGLGDVAIAEYEKGLELDDSLRITALSDWKKSLAINSDQSTVGEKVKKWEHPPLFGK